MNYSGNYRDRFSCEMEPSWVNDPYADEEEEEEQYMMKLREEDRAYDEEFERENEEILKEEAEEAHQKFWNDRNNEQLLSEFESLPDIPVLVPITEQIILPKEPSHAF